MLAVLLAHRMSVMAARRRIVEEQEETTEGPTPKASHSDITRSSFSDICRTCLGTSKLQPIFCNSLHEEMSQKLKVATGLEIRKDDNLPQKICNKCSKIINASLNIRITSARAEKTLLKIAKTKIKKESANHEKTAFPLAEIKTRTVKVEYDSYSEDDFDSRDIIQPKLENLKDTKPKVQNVQNFQYILTGRKSNRDEKPMLNKLGITKKKIVKNIVPVEWDRNVKKEDRISSAKSSRHLFSKDVKPRKSTPTLAERQKLYREKVKQMGLVKNADGVLVSRRKLLQEQTRKVVKPPAAQPRRVLPPLPKVPPFICPTCNRDCPTRAALITHYRGHIYYFVCEDCGKRVLSKYALLQHQRAIHGLTKIHKCSYCDYSAANKDGLLVHERRHTGERPFICDYCGAGFAARRTLIQHIGLHMPDTIPCPFCPKLLRSERLLSNHKADKHGKRYSYQCPSCPKSFGSVKTVRRHLLGIHKVPFQEQPKIEKFLHYQCPCCPKNFKQRKYIRRHLAGVHKLPTQEQPKIVKTLL